MANYTTDELNKKALQARDDLNKVKMYLSSSTNGDAQDLSTIIQGAVDNGSYRGTRDFSSIVNSKYFHIRYYKKNEFFKNIRAQEESRLSRLKSYYKWLKKYEEVNKKKEEKNKINKVQNAPQKKLLKKVEKEKKKANSTVFKSPTQIANEFAVRNDQQIQSAIYDFETKWTNNDVKVGNIFVSNYKDLKSEFKESLEELEAPYTQIANYYNVYAAKYGFGDLVKNSIDCLIKNTPLNIVKEAYEEAMKEITAFIKDADTVMTESLNIVDNSIGIVEEVYDATKTIQKDLKDYKKSLKNADVKTTQDAIRNKMRAQFLNVLLPALTAQVSNVLNAIVENLCEDDQTATVNINTVVDEIALRNQLKNVYGIGTDTVMDDYLSMLTDVSGFLTPREICNLFDGQASDYVLELLTHFISTFYNKIFLRMNTKQRIASFFLLIGNLVDKDFCSQVNLRLLNEQYCSESPSPYAAKLRKCLLEKNPDLATETREAYLNTKKKQLKDALAFSFFPMDMRASQKEINKIFNKIKEEQTEDPLLELAGEYKSKYHESLMNMYSNFIDNYEVTLLKENFISEILGRATQGMDEDAKSKAESEIANVPVIMMKYEKQILPDFIRSIFLSEEDIAVSSKLDRMSISKTYDTSGISWRNLQKILKALLDLESGDVPVNPEKLFYNSEIISSYYQKTLAHEYNASKSSKQELKFMNGFSFSAGVEEDYGDPDDTGNLDNVINYKFNLEYSEKLPDVSMKHPFYDFTDKITHGWDQKGPGLFYQDWRHLFKGYARATYNQLANICSNSVFAKKIPIGQSSANDSGNVSGLELIRLSPEEPCAEGLNLDFDLINFENIAKQVANLDIEGFNPDVSDEDEEREKFFNNLMIFKSAVLDFVIKSIFVFSEFSFEEEEVDETMVDFVYLEFFKSLLDKDKNLKEENIFFLSLGQKEQKNFLENVKYYDYEGGSASFEQELVCKDLLDEFGIMSPSAQEKEWKKSWDDFMGGRWTKLCGTEASKEKFRDVYKYRKTWNCRNLLTQFYALSPKLKEKEWKKSWDDFMGGRFTKNAGCTDSFKEAFRIAYRDRYSENTLSALIESVLENVKSQKLDEKYINLTYNVAQALLYFYNVNNPQNQTEEFCEAVRRLIRKEISNMSKALKDIIYTDHQKQSKVFNLEDRLIEKQLNIIPLSEQKSLGFRNSYPEKRKYAFAAIKNMATEMMTYDYPYFIATQECDDYVRHPKGGGGKLMDVVDSQFGHSSFFFTRLKSFDPKKDTADVEVYCCFYKNHLDEKALGQSSIPIKKLGTINEEDLAKQCYEATAAKVPSEWSKIFPEKLVMDGVTGLYNALKTPSNDIAAILGILINSAWFKDYSKKGRTWGRVVDATSKSETKKIWANVTTSPFQVNQIIEKFDAQYKDVWNWGTLEISIKDDLGRGNPETDLAIEMLESAKKYVSKNAGRTAPAKFINYHNVNKEIPGSEDPLPKEYQPPPLSGISQPEYESVKNGGRDALWDLMEGHDGVPETPMFAFKNYPFTPVSQFFGRDRHTGARKSLSGRWSYPETNSWLVDDYKHRKTRQSSPVTTGYSATSLLDEVKNHVVLQIVKNATQRISPGGVAMITPWMKRDIYYNERPVATFKINTKNYADFKANFKKAYDKDATDDDYFNICLKPQIVEGFKAAKVISPNLFKTSFPIKKMISHIACNMNNYVEYINNVGPTLGSSNLSPSRVTTSKSLDNFSLFNSSLLMGGGAALGGLAAGQAQSIARKNNSLTALDILNKTQSFDFSLYFVKTSIRSYLSIIEQEDLNIKISKKMADLIGTAASQIYSKAGKIVDSANKIGSVFGATAGEGIPSQADLVSDFRGMRLLFNPPTTPFALANLYAGIWPTSGWASWISYLILEPILLAMELAGDEFLKKQLKNLLFGEDTEDNSFAAAEANFKAICEKAKDKAAKANPIIKIDGKDYQKTAGGEYLYPDGSDYAGYYHQHKDKTFMSGRKHTDKSFVLAKVFNREDLE